MGEKLGKPRGVYPPTADRGGKGRTASPHPGEEKGNATELPRSMQTIKNI